MATSEAQIRATMKYNKENKQQVKFEINRKTEADLLNWLNQQDNKQGYIKSLILADMEAHRTSTD